MKSKKRAPAYEYAREVSSWERPSLSRREVNDALGRAASSPRENGKTLILLSENSSKLCFVSLLVDKIFPKVHCVQPEGPDDCKKV